MRKVLLLLLPLIQLTTSAQNIGVGTNNPYRAKLEVHGANDYTAAIFGGDGTGISLQRNWPGIGFNSYYNGGHRHMANGYSALQFFDPTSGYMAFDLGANGNGGQFWNSSKRVLSLFPSGNVTIGTQLSNSSLSVSRPYGVDATAYFFGTTHHSTFNFGSDENTYIRAGKDNGTVFINDIPNSKVVMNGPVGINTATPVYPLEIRQQTVNNATRSMALIEPTNFNNWVFFISSFQGVLYFYCNGITRGTFSSSDGHYESYSDKRLKTAVQPLSPVLQKLKQLQPVKYEMKYNNPEHQKSIGFIAQDVKPLFPQLVTILPDTSSGYKNITDVHTMNYGSLSVISIKAIQEQQAIINEQEKTLQELQAEYETLNKKLDEFILHSSKNKR